MEYKVREMRIKRGMTQEELSEKSGVSRQTIVRLEGDGDYFASTRVLSKIAETLDCRIGEIFICNN